MARCCAEVWPSGGYHPGSCERTASVTRDGRHYCKQHDPVAVKARDDARSAKWQVKRDVQRAELAYRASAVALAEAVPEWAAGYCPACRRFQASGHATFCEVVDFHASKAALAAAKGGA